MSIIIILAILLNGGSYAKSTDYNISPANNMQEFIYNIKIMSAISMEENGKGKMLDNSGCVYRIDGQNIVKTCAQIIGVSNDNGIPSLFGALTEELIPFEYTWIE